MESIQWASVIVSISVLFLCYIRLKNKTTKKYIIIPVIILMLHSMVFYVFVFLKNHGIYSIADDFVSWSSILRFHSFSTIFLLEFYGYMQEGKWKPLQ